MNLPNSSGQALAWQFVATQAEWDSVWPSLAQESELAVDIESNGFFRYPDRICLIQIGTQDQVYLLDPLALDSLEALGSLLADPRCCKVFHACENDLRALDRDFGFQVKNIFDTAVAAHFLGMERLGLANVLKEFLNIDIPKTKALQRQDWTLRPLEQESLAYAASDVFHLLELKAILAERLLLLGRLRWVQEENSWLEKIKSEPPPTPSDWLWNVKQSKELGAQERAILQQLLIFREELCRELDRPPFRVLSDETLVNLARNPHESLKDRKGLFVIFQMKKQAALRQILKTGQRALPVLLRMNPGRKSTFRLGEKSKRRLQALKAWRKKLGQTLAMDPALLWPLTSLERLAHQESMLPLGPEVREWQKKEFYHEVEEVLTAPLEQNQV